MKHEWDVKYVLAQTLQGIFNVIRYVKSPTFSPSGILMPQKLPRKTLSAAKANSF